MNPADLLRGLVVGNQCKKIRGRNRKFCPTDYQKKVNTGGPIEEQYLKNGPFAVHEWTAMAAASFHYYEIFYPAHMAEKCPVVVFCNGTGVKASAYKPILRHLASWGFIAIGTEEEHSFSGFSAEMCIRYLKRLSEMQQLPDGSENPIYEKVDFDRVGISGHSQGGAAVFNTITQTHNAPIYKCAYVISPANKDLAHAFLWDYDIADVRIPTVIVAGTGPFDTNFVINLQQLQELYADINNAAFRVIARRKDTDHGEMLYSTDGYMTAFFCWQLQGDPEAEKAFAGLSPEIMINPQYQDQQYHLS